MELLVVGAGAVGRWFAGLADAEVAFADVDPAAAEAAAEAIGGRAVPLEGEGRFDAVAVAVPLPAAVDAIAAQAHRAEAAVVDLTGTMTEPVAAMAEHAPAAERLSLHPLFAPANAPGRIAAVADASGPVTEGLRADLEAAGNELFETTPAAHDRAMETVQAKAHAALLAFALAADEVDPAFGTPIYDRLAGAVAELTDGEPRVYADIQAAFDGADDVAAAARELAEADREAFEALFRDAGA
ncbi:MAG: prephenate dehydrogenase [Halobacteriales archaeon]|nr:prephenate dehydrogenase [Halobacteriales archaeon]